MINRVDTRRLLSSITADVLVGTRMDRAARRLFPDRVAILAYHNVIPDGYDAGGDANLHLCLGRFRDQLDILEATHRIIPLEALEAEDDGENKRPRAVITFDDAYEGALRFALPELVERGLAATVFLAPGLLGDGGFWWDQLVDRQDGTQSQRLRQKVLSEFSGRTEEARELASEEKYRFLEPPAYCRPASASSVLQAGGLPGISLAPHTWSHPDLTRLDPSEIHDELVRPLNWFESRDVSFLRWLAYPYGRYSSDVGRIAAATGYRGAFLVDGGLADGQRLADGRMHLPRVSVPADIERSHFLLRTSGVVRR